MQHRIDHLEGLVDFFSNLGTSQDDLATDEYQEHNLGLNHAVDKAREQLRLVRAEIMMARGQTLQANGELDVAGADNVLDLEIGELGVEAELLDDTGIFARSKLRVIFRLSTGNNHLARGKDEGSGLGLADTHDDSGETLLKLAI